MLLLGRSTLESWVPSLLVSLSLSPYPLSIYILRYLPLYRFHSKVLVGLHWLFVVQSFRSEGSPCSSTNVCSPPTPHPALFRFHSSPLPSFYFIFCNKYSLISRIKEHIQNEKSSPLLVFPEGVCVNNEYCVMFKKGAFELGAVVYPIAIKYKYVQERGAEILFLFFLLLFFSQNKI